MAETKSELQWRIQDFPEGTGANLFFGKIFAENCMKEKLDREVHPSVADLREVRGTPPPQGSKFFQFYAVFGKFWQNRMLAPPGKLAPPPGENLVSATVPSIPRSSTELYTYCFINNHVRLIFNI